MATTQTIRRTSSIRNVDDYRPGAVIDHEGRHVTVIGYRRTAGDGGQYIHELTVRPATAEESRRKQVADLRHRLSSMVAGPDDDRGRAAHGARRRKWEDELRSLEGRPSLDEEEAAAGAKSAAELPGHLADAHAAHRVPRDAREPDGDGGGAAGMNEHDEAALVSYLRDLLADNGPLTADDLLQNCREVLEAYRVQEKTSRGAHTREGIKGHRRALADIATWERILGDPAVREVLLRVEDGQIFGAADDT